VEKIKAGFGWVNLKENDHLKGLEEKGIILIIIRASRNMMRQRLAKDWGKRRACNVISGFITCREFLEYLRTLGL
jgi:hypothetical protein